MYKKPKFFQFVTQMLILKAQIEEFRKLLEWALLENYYLYNILRANINSKYIQPEIETQLHVQAKKKMNFEISTKF